jgi:DHA2 family multidrug resistance protein-like MFS transporter
VAKVPLSVSIPGGAPTGAVFNGSPGFVVQSGGALGLALVGTIGTAVYRGEVAEGLPAGVSVAARDSARETLGGAVEAAERLPVVMRADFLDPAREAFTQALQLAATVSGAIVAAAALLVATVVRADTPDGSDEHLALLAPPAAIAVAPCA